MERLDPASVARPRLLPDHPTLFSSAKENLYPTDLTVGSRTYADCYKSDELVAWLLQAGYAADNFDGVDIGQRLIRDGRSCAWDTTIAVAYPPPPMQPQVFSGSCVRCCACTRCTVLRTRSRPRLCRGSKPAFSLLSRRERKYALCQLAMAHGKVITGWMVS